MLLIVFTLNDQAVRSDSANQVVSSSQEELEPGSSFSSEQFPKDNMKNLDNTGNGIDEATINLDSFSRKESLIMNYEQILYEVEDGIATVTLNRPDKLNAMTAQMGAELADAMAEADEDDQVRVVVMTGAGRGFCAGADLGSGDEFAGGWGGTEKEYRRMMPQEVRKPVIAAINGPAVGAGLTWPLQADIRYVADDAKLAFAFVRRGVLPELASHVILPRLAGLAKASELLLSGRTFLGEEAVEFGVATRSFPKDQVLPEAMKLAKDIATNAAPVPVAIAKRLIWEGVGFSLADWRKKEGALFLYTTQQPDAREGTMAFFERRDPNWSGSITKDFPDWPDED